MRQIYFTLTLFPLLFQNVHSQTVLQSSTTIPGAGESHTYDLSTSYVPSGLTATGAGQTWDFTSMVKDTVTTFNWILPSNTTDGSNFPNSTLALDYLGSGLTIEEFFQIDSSAFTMMGQFITGISRFKSASGRQILSFPISLNTSDSASWSGEVDFFGSPQKQDRNGTSFFYCDAGGTFTSTYGTTNNVLKVVWTDSYQDEIGGVIQSTYRDTVVWWFDGVNPGPMATHLNYWKDGAKLVQQTLLRNGVNSGIEFVDNQDEILIYPNPSHSELHVEPILGLTRAELTNIQGQVLDFKTALGSERITFNTRSIEPGTYFIRMELNGSIQVRPVVIH